MNYHIRAADSIGAATNKRGQHPAIIEAYSTSEVSVSLADLKQRFNPGKMNKLAIQPGSLVV